jgi:hypothetical protein
MNNLDSSDSCRSLSTFSEPLDKDGLDWRNPSSNCSADIAS